MFGNINDIDCIVTLFELMRAEVSTHNLSVSSSVERLQRSLHQVRDLEGEGEGSRVRERVGEEGVRCLIVPLPPTIYPVNPPLPPPLPPAPTLSHHPPPTTLLPRIPYTGSACSVTLTILTVL